MSAVAKDARELLTKEGPAALHRALADAVPFDPSTGTGTKNPSRGITAVEIPGDEGDDDPEFPMHLLPGVAGEMASEIARVTTSQNTPLAAVSVLGVLSASVGAGLVMPYGGERWTRPNLFILAIAESGSGKGESFDLAAKPLDDEETEMIDDFDTSLLPRLLAELKIVEARSKSLLRNIDNGADDEAEAALKAEFYESETQRKQLEQKIRSGPRIKVGDVTKEALTDLIQGQPGEALASMSSEARGILNVIKGRYSSNGGDEDFYCSAYSGEPFVVDRVSRGRIRLSKPCLTAVWMVQPDAARSALATDAMTESGLLPRFIMFDAEAEPKIRNGFPDPIPRRIKSGWEEMVRSLLKTYREKGDEPVAVTPDAGALSVLADYENEIILRRRKDGDLHDVAAYAARWAQNASRLALVLHVAKYGAEAHKHMLEGETAEDAVEMMRWFAQRQLRVLGAARRDAIRKRVLAVLAVLAECHGEISMRDLRRNHSINEEEVRWLEQEMPGHFWVVERKPKGGGRPSIMVTTTKPSTVNPEGHSYPLAPAVKTADIPILDVTTPMKN